MASLHFWAFPGATAEDAMKPDTVSSLLTFPEAAAYLGVPLPTLRVWRRNGLLPVVKLGGQAKSRVRFRRTDLDAFIAANTSPATTGPLAPEHAT